MRAAETCETAEAIGSLRHAAGCDIRLDKVGGGRVVWQRPRQQKNGLLSLRIAARSCVSDHACLNALDQGPMLGGLAIRKSRGARVV